MAVTFGMGRNCLSSRGFHGARGLENLVESKYYVWQLHLRASICIYCIYSHKHLKTLMKWMILPIRCNSHTRTQM